MVSTLDTERGGGGGGGRVKWVYDYLCSVRILAGEDKMWLYEWWAYEKELLGGKITESNKILG